MKHLVLSALLITLFAGTVEAGAQTHPRPRAASQGMFGGMTSGVIAIGVGVAAAATGIALIAGNNSTTGHTH